MGVLGNCLVATSVHMARRRPENSLGNILHRHLDGHLYNGYVSVEAYQTFACKKEAMSAEKNISFVTEQLKQYDVQLQKATTPEELFEQLTAYINQLITKDFNRLITLLYRLDVPEAKLRYYLHQNKGEEAAKLIAQLIIQRQMEKIKARKAFKPNNDIPEEERW